MVTIWTQQSFVYAILLTVRHSYRDISDFEGRKIKLFDSTSQHIRANHPDVKDPVEFVTAVLKNPTLITKDKLPDTVIYHRAVKKPLMHIAYVEVKKSFVKSAHITDKVKGGEILWLKPTKDLLSPNL